MFNHHPVSHCFFLCKPDLMHAVSHCMLEPVEYARVVQYDSHSITYLWSAPGWGEKKTQQINLHLVKEWGKNSGSL